MLIDMQPLALRAGISVERYWSMDMNEIIAQSKANNQRKYDQIKERAIMDHKLSELMAFAVNEPNKMPDIKKMYGIDVEADEPQPQSAEPIPEWKKDQAEFMKQAEMIRNTRNARKNKQGGE